MNVNNTVPEELKVIVERAVRPVQANMARKRKMREELLTHLVSVFEEEAEKLSDERTALQRAKTRFGDPKELSRQLQGTVPAWSRFRFLLEKLRLEPGESLLHFAGKMVSFTFLSWAALIVLLLPRLTTVWQVSQTGALVRILVVVAIASAAFSFALIVLVDRMSRAVYGKASERSLCRAVLIGLASLVVLPMFTFLIYWSLPLDGSTRFSYLKLSCLLAPVVPVLLLLLGRQQAEEIRYEDEWASLHIAE